MRRVGSSTLPLIVLGLVLAWGGWLRFAGLGLNTFGTDEMNHFYVGQSLERGDGPVLPSGSRYTRGLDYSQMVAAMLPHAEQPEVAVRVPAAILGFLGLLVFAAVAWSIGGPWTAVVSTLLLAIYPEALRLARYGRFYTLQLLAVMVAMYAGWRLLRDPLTVERMKRRRLLQNWGWGLLALAALTYATGVQVVTLSVAAGFGLAVAAAGVLDYRRHRRAAWRWSATWQMTVLGAAAVLLFLVARFRELEELFWQSRTMPMWARLSDEGAGPVAAYYRMLSESFPIIVALAPLIFLACLLRRPRAGAYLLAWFAVPFLLHSFVFPWKSERYILGAVPALLLAAGWAGAIGLEALRRYLGRALYRLAPRGPARPAAFVITAVIAFFVIVTLPAFNESRRSINTRTSTGWLESRELIDRDSALRGLPLGSASPLAALHYWGRLDFVVQRALLEGLRRDTASHDFDRPYLMKPMGSPDVYAGRPTLTTPDAIRERFGEAPAVLIGVDQKYLTYRNIEPALERSLELEATELCQGKCGSMLLYYWPLNPPKNLDVLGGSAHR